MVNNGGQWWTMVDNGGQWYHFNQLTFQKDKNSIVFTRETTLELTTKEATLSAVPALPTLPT